MLNKITPLSMPVLIKDLGSHYPTEESKYRKRFGLYKCHCGNEFKAQISSIKSGNTNSCGCYKKKRISESRITHGFGNHKLYYVWSDMVRRCNNPKIPTFKHYGGRGIKVCDRWLKVENFIEDMESLYKQGLSIDRINNDGNYEPSNCRWVTNEVQRRNTCRINVNNKSGYRGVSLDKKSKKWVSQIKVKSKRISLGYYITKLEAAKAYDTYVIEHNLEHTINGVLLC